MGKEIRYEPPTITEISDPHDPRIGVIVIHSDEPLMEDNWCAEDLVPDQNNPNIGPN